MNNEYGTYRPAQSEDLHLRTRLVMDPQLTNASTCTGNAYRYTTNIDTGRVYSCSTVLAVGVLWNQVLQYTVKTTVNDMKR